MDTKGLAEKSFIGARHLIQKDLEALPEDVFAKSFGPASRTVADIIFEVNLVNDHVGTVIRGEPPFDWPEDDWIKAPADFQTKADVIAEFQKSAQKFLETIREFSHEQLEELLILEEKARTRFERCQFVTQHMWYHSGQLNYIQTLIGDDAMHWG